MSRVDSLASDMARSSVVRKSKTKWNQKNAQRVRFKLAPGQERLAVMSPAQKEEARRQANKARFMADVERQYAEEAAAYRRARGLE